MSFSQVLSAALDGLEVRMVQVESDLSSGLPVFHMVGYLSSEVREAAERVRTAVHNIGVRLPAKKIVINLSPGDVRKKGASFDLPVAVSLLAALGEVPKDALADTLVIGELGLNGEIRAVTGVLPIAEEAGRQGIKRCIVPEENEREGGLIKSVEMIGAPDLAWLCSYLNGEKGAKKKSPKEEARTRRRDAAGADFADIKGQRALKRAAEIAVAGKHNLLMIGPPGSGKTMIASRIPTILPPLTREESLEITKIYSVQGLLSRRFPLVTKRPFREVHHTVTRTALVGGGYTPAPGEITLANKGVLFLDELAEFSASVLETLRQPLEARKIRLTRIRGTYEFPADFLLIAASNPCPCGNYPDYEKCACTPAQIQRYMSRLSQPFLNRIDICTEAPKVAYRQLSGEEKEETSAQIQGRIIEARKRQEERYKGLRERTNGALGASEVRKFCIIDEEGEKLMEQAYESFNLTARTYHKTLKVARTIADLEKEERIQKKHLREALSYRVMDKKEWGRA